MFCLLVSLLFHLLIFKKDPYSKKEILDFAVFVCAG